MHSQLSDFIYAADLGQRFDAACFSPPRLSHTQKTSFLSRITSNLHTGDLSAGYQREEEDLSPKIRLPTTHSSLKITTVSLLFNSRFVCCYHRDYDIGEEGGREDGPPSEKGQRTTEAAPALESGGGERRRR